MLFGKGPRYVKAAAPPACAAVSLPHQQKIFVVSQIHAAGRRVFDGAAQLRPVFQGDHKGPLLIELGKIEPVAVDKGKVGGHNNLFRVNTPPLRDGRGALQLGHKGIFINMQTPRRAIQKTQGMELRHAVEAYRSRHGKGHGRFCDKVRRKAKAADCRSFPLHQCPVVQGVHDRGPFFKLTGNISAAASELLHGAEIGFQVKLRLLLTELFDHVLVQGVMLGREHGGGASGHAAADFCTLHQQIIRARLLQPQCAQHTRHSSADDQHAGVPVSLQRGKAGRRGLLCP